MQDAANEAVTLQAAALPDLICTTTADIQANQTIAELPLGHPWLQLITPPKWQTTGLQPNATITPTQDDSPEAVCKIVANAPIGPNEMILVQDAEEPGVSPIQIVGQFDGSSLRDEGVGGAGYVICN